MGVRRRRAVGPAGAHATPPDELVARGQQVDDDLRDESERERDDEERLRRERPPHHDPR